jgi:hypothetical protein
MDRAWFCGRGGRGTVICLMTLMTRKHGTSWREEPKVGHIAKLSTRAMSGTQIKVVCIFIYLSENVAYPLDSAPKEYLDGTFSNAGLVKLDCILQ